MNPSTKKILLVTSLLATAILIGFGLYYMFKKTGAGGVEPTPTEKIDGGILPSAGERTSTVSGTEITTGQLERGGITNPLPIPQIAPGGYYQNETIKKVIDEPVTYPSLSQGNGSLRYYNSSDGKFYYLTADGQIKTLSDQTFYNVNKVTWAAKNDKAVLEYPDKSKIIYNFEKQKQTTLPKHWSDFSFSPDSSQLAAKSIGLAPENRWLVSVNDDGTGANFIEPMGDNADKVQVNWSPSRQTVAFSQTGEPLGAERQEILFVGLNHENFKSAIVEGRGFTPEWSPSGQKLLYSVYSSRSDFKPELWITDSYGDSIGNNRQLLQLNTWADKCTFSDDTTVFCAVPRDLPQGAGILPEVAANSNDDIYKIDLKTGLKISVPIDGNYNIKNITYDQNKNKLYFTNGNQAGVFEIKL